MYRIEFTAKGKQALSKLDKTTQLRIIKKLQYFISQPNPLAASKPLVNLPPATHRFRFGDYRIAFYIEKDRIYIDRIGHRKEVYYLEIKME